MTLILPQHIVTVVCDRPSLRVSGLINGDTTPETSGGRGGWEATNRTRRTAIVEWSGPDAETYELAMRLTVDATGDVDAARERLDRMCRMPAENVAPPLVRIEGLVPPAGRVWAIQGLEIEETQRDQDGRYTDLVAVLSLLLAENTGDGVNVARRIPSVHRVRKGDTIQKLAIRYYGAARHARALGAAQRPRIRDVRKPLKVGSLVRLP